MEPRTYPGNRYALRNPTWAEEGRETCSIVCVLSAGFSPQKSNSVRKIFLHDLRLVRLQSIALDDLLLGERVPLLEHRLQLLLRRGVVDVVDVARQDSAALQGWIAWLKRDQNLV